MNFLAPLFLLGALAVAAPVIFHLIRRTTRDRTRFSSLLFLQPDPPRLTQRSRIENWLLLLLRAAALALLALAFARPFIRTETPLNPGSDKNRRIVILVDTSASMQRDGLFPAAREKAEELLRGAGPGDQAALWTFDATTRRLMDFTEWTALPAESRAATAAGRLAEVTPGWGNTQLATALTTAAERLAEIPPGETSPGGGEIILISDLQEGSRVEGLQGWEWPQEVFVTSIALTAKQTGNAGLQLAPDSVTLAAGEEPQARVRVWNAPDSTGEQFQIGWAAAGEAFTGPAHDVVVPPGQSKVVALPWSADLQSAPEHRPAQPPLLNSTIQTNSNNTATSSPASQPQSQPAGADFKSALQPSRRILLKGDPEPFDNTVFTAPPVAVEVAAHYFGAELLTDSKKPLFFLNRALPESRQVSVKLNLVPPEAALPVILPGQPAIFFANGAIPPAQATFLHQQLQSGRTALLILSAAAAPALAVITGTGAVPLEDIKPTTYGMLSEIDFKHPLFAPFADPRFSDFTKIRFWHYTKFAATALPGSRVLARFDSGDPALVEVPVGQGRLMVLASGWEPGSSQWALSSKFVPLLSSLLEWSGAVVTPPAQFFAGQPVPLNLLGLTGVGPVSVRHPEWTTTTVTPEAGAFMAAAQPGLYTATGGTLTKTFGVNLDPAESRTLPLPTDELDRLGVPVRRADGREPGQPNSGPAPAVETESRQKLWRWIMIAALAVLLIETLLAGLSARRAPAPGGSAV
ncbi:MAG: BatA domain-containing protein [Verrucomicrobiota bacterium]